MPTSRPDPLVLLDANVLAKPVTRTLLLRLARSGYDATWSRTCEVEADRHGGPRRVSVTEVRERLGMVLAPTGVVSDRFTATSPTDRQILADAQETGATFILTEDVDDFAAEDLTMTGISAVNPDLFLAERSTRAVYADALTAMSSRTKNPSLTPSELHARIARQHPRLFAAHADLYDVTASSSGHNPPGVLFRGGTCLRCLRADAGTSPLGLCTLCQAS